jgi:flagellar protein FliJ
MSTRRIETVVRVRRLQEQLASAEVARTRHAALTAEADEQAAWQLVARHSPTQSGIAAVLAERDKLEGGIAHARRHGDRTATAHHHLDLALDDWRGAMQRLDGIERLNERLVATERAEQTRKEIVELDDLVVMRWEGDDA